MNPPQPPLGATPEPSATPRTDAALLNMSEFWRGETGKSCYVNAVVARALEIELAEMTARAVSLSLHLPPETLVGDVRRWRDEAKAQLAELATARAALAQEVEDGKRLREALITCLPLVTNNRLGNRIYMEEQVYIDINKCAQVIKVAIAAQAK